MNKHKKCLSVNQLIHLMAKLDLLFSHVKIRKLLTKLLIDVNKKN